MDANARLDEFIDEYSAAVAADGRWALAALREMLPTATRLVYNNYNALVVAFGTGEKVGDIILSLAFYPRYLRLFFLRGTLLPDPGSLLEGEGSTVRSVRLDPVSRLRTSQVNALIGAAAANASPLPEAGEGPLVIKSVSAKRRPRRPKV